MAREREAPRAHRGLTRALLLVGCVTLLLAAPAGAAAKQTVPPGNSEIDQYTETLPGPSGGQPVNGIGGATSGSGSVLSPATARRLEQRGPDGKAIADLANATAPKRETKGGRSAGGSSSGFKTLVDTVSGSDDGGGLGILMPLILVLVTAAGVGFVLLRRRARLPG